MARICPSRRASVSSVSVASAWRTAGGRMLSWSRWRYLGQPRPRSGSPQIQGRVAHVDPVDARRAAPDVVQTADQMADDDLAQPETHKGHQLAGFGDEAWPRVAPAATAPGRPRRPPPSEAGDPPRPQVVEVDVVETPTRADPNSHMRSFSVIIGCEVRTWRARSNDTSAVITSTLSIFEAVQSAVDQAQVGHQGDHGPRRGHPVPPSRRPTGEGGAPTPRSASTRRRNPGVHGLGDADVAPVLRQAEVRSSSPMRPKSLTSSAPATLKRSLMVTFVE